MSAPGQESPLILVVEDQANHRKVIQGVLEGKGYRVVAVKDAPGARAALAAAKSPPSLVLTDLKLPGDDGLKLLKELRQDRPGLPVILMTAFGSIPSAVEAMRLGAHDFLAKPLDFEELARTISKALAASSRELREWVMETAGERPLIGRSQAMEEVHRLIRKAGPSDATVLVLGETGTGKELVAAEVHAAGPRREGPFIKVHCGAIPEDLLEAELFGHEKGAFTGAVREKPGKFELADGGTIFLDEVGTMSPVMQVKLLRVLQSGEFDRVGGTRTLKADVRVIAATNQDLQKAVAEKLFRDDLYYRLNVIPILIPPLRERREDIPDLAAFFLERHAKKNGRPAPEVEPDALRALCSARWEGNVRQLENLLERIVILMEGERIRRSDLPPEILSAA
ncbi:MAG: sigma-54-dependent Fis family transcriptional regulator [Elusimicrobia bacterium]|nr:sigma-54-dependent Fis family transcriptional regulator [Elusimicrobiota bacterium]